VFSALNPLHARRRPLIGVAVLFGFVSAIVALLLWLDALTDMSARVVRLRSAEFQLATQPDALPDAERWQHVALPDNWSRQRRDAQGIGWYRLAFDVPVNASDAEGLALHVKRLSMTAVFYLNGHMLPPPMQLAEPMLRMWNTPQYRSLPSDWLKPGRNEIAVRLFSYRDYNGGLGLVDLGPDDDVYRIYLRTHFLHSTASAAALLALFVIGLLAIAIGLRFARDGSPLFLGLSCMVWSARLANDYLQSIPVGWQWWGWVTHSLGGWVPLLMLMYCHRYLRLKRRRLEHFMLGYTVACTALMGAYLFSWISKDALAVVWLPFNLATDLYILHILWRLLRRSVTAAPFLLAVALGFFVLADLHDRLIVTAIFEPLVSFDATYWRPLSGILLSLAFCLLVADQFIGVVDEARQGAADKQTALVLERERIMREMHDGLGAQLMTALRGIERGALGKEQVVQSLHDGLDELRMLMDSTDTQQSLASALVAWRNRWDARLAAAGVSLLWRVDESVDAVQLGSDAVMQIMRILQEAAANILKHSGATGMTLMARVAQPTPDAARRLLCIDIEDDGTRGPAGDSCVVRPGARGLKNMAFRAGQIGAELAVTARTAPETGWAVRLRLPVP
jgi:signal transduction histidine kinase